jgi:hypothetical protein
MQVTNLAGKTQTTTVDLETAEGAPRVWFMVGTSEKAETWAPTSMLWPKFCKFLGKVRIGAKSGLALAPGWPRPVQPPLQAADRI